jgi:hypothetical protein
MGHIALAMGTGRAVDSHRFGEFKELILERIAREERKIRKLEKLLAQHILCAGSLKAMDLESLPVVVMEGFLGGKPAGSDAPGDAKGSDAPMDMDENGDDDNDDGISLDPYIGSVAPSVA